MYTTSEWLNKANSYVNKRVTVPTNPFGGQCAAYVDFLVRWGTDGQKNLAYTNAIDLLATAERMGLKTVRFNGSNYTFEPGDIWVTRTTAHIYGHTGIFTSGGGQPTTLEQNVDGNADALTNGGWVRAKKRLLYPSGLMTYTDIVDTQYLVGWIKAPVNRDAVDKTVDTAAEDKKNKIRRSSPMYGSFFFAVKGGDPKFSANATYFWNVATNEIRGLTNADELTAIEQLYLRAYGEKPASITYTTSAPWYVRLMEGLGTNVFVRGSKYDSLKGSLDSLNTKYNGLSSGVTSITNTIKETTVSADTGVKGYDITAYSKFKSTTALNIRELPDPSSSRLGTLAAGVEVDILGSAYAKGYYWVNFSYNGKSAYVVSKVSDGDFTGKLS